MRSLLSEVVVGQAACAAEPWEERSAGRRLCSWRRLAPSTGANTLEPSRESECVGVTIVLASILLGLSCHSCVPTPGVSLRRM